MSRSIKKGPFVAPELLKRVEELNKAGEKKVLKTWSRASTIFPSFVMLRNVFVFSKEALGQSGSGSVLSNQRAWAELLSAEDVETKHRQTSEEEQSVDVTTGSKEYTNIMEVFPAQELVLEDGTLCISVTDKQLLYLDAGRSADEIFISVNGEPVEIPEKNQMASAHRLIWLGTFEAQEVMISVTDRMGTLVAAQEMELGALHENAWQAALLIQ